MPFTNSLSSGADDHRYIGGQVRCYGAEWISGKCDATDHGRPRERLGHRAKIRTTLNSGFAGTYQDRLDSINYPYDISYIRWSGHGDNAPPGPQICEFIKAWNEEYGWPRFEIASTSTAFSVFENRYGHLLPELRSDLTPYWEDGAGSSALETSINRNSADRMVQVQALAAMLSPRASPSTSTLKEYYNHILDATETDAYDVWGWPLLPSFFCRSSQAARIASYRPWSSSSSKSLRFSISIIWSRLIANGQTGRSWCEWSPQPTPLSYRLPRG
jgi:hypothetical protein